MILFLLPLAALALVAFGVALAAHWLFIVIAAVLAFAGLVSFLARARPSRRPASGGRSSNRHRVG